MLNIIYKMNRNTILSDYKLWFQQKKIKVIYKPVLNELLLNFKNRQHEQELLLRQLRLKEYNARYYQVNKEHIDTLRKTTPSYEERQDRVRCDCGEYLTKSYMTKHLKTN